ncbi:MBG domain-containing protein [Flavobacterium anhuiense]|uniref:MBG domain-containing protein n=1 Tax=Flavobacterium anhuiense TaxID=459526 RepID=UPI003D9692AA
MRKIYTTILVIFLFSSSIFAQSTETFETEIVGNTSFTDNGVVFNVISQTGGPFVITNVAGTGWNGTAADNQYIDNSNAADIGVPVQFTIKSTSNAFKLKSLYLLLRQSDLNPGIGTVNIKGNFKGSNVFDLTLSGPFNNTSSINTGFDLIDLGTYSTFANAIIDEYTISTTGSFEYVALDAMKWEKVVSGINVNSSLTPFTSCQGLPSSQLQSFSASGSGLNGDIMITAPTGFEVSLNAGGSYANIINIPNIGGNVNNTTVYVRMAASAIGSPSGNLTLYSNGIDPKTLALTGTVNSAPAITGNLSSIAICTGANTNFSVIASNATGYKWQVDKGAGAGFTDVPNSLPYSGINTSTLTITGATAALNGYKYQVIVSGGCTPSATSNSATLTINSAPSITTQPSVTPITVCDGNTATISVTASNATGYQWYVDQGAGFNPVPNSFPYSGMNTNTLTITGATAALSGYIYRVVASGNCTPNATSNNVALIVNSSPSIIAQPSSKVTCAGENTIFSVSASNATGYQWQVEKGQGFENISDNATYSGTTTATLSITGTTSALNGYLYRAVANGTCTPITVSNNASLTVKSIPAITADPSSITICSGGNATFSVTASNATAYKWQVDQGNGLGFLDVPSGSFYSGFNTPTLIINGAPPTFNGYKFRAIASGSCTPAATSNVATLTVKYINIVTAQNNILCFGSSTGFATASVTGGVGAYTYSWSNGASSASISGLIAGTYTVTVSDEGGCSNTASVTIGQPSSPLTLTAGTVTNVSCYGGANGTAEVIASGGTPGLTYSWNTSPIQSTATARGLAAGTYTVTVKDGNQCVKTLDFEISAPPALVLTQGPITHVSCKGGANGTATVIVADGKPNYSYSWNTNPVQTTATATGLTAGTYTVTVSDNNTCTKTLPFTIKEPAILDATISKTDVLCRNSATGTATVSPTGGSGTYTYLWSPSGGTAATATGLAIGNYTCLITDFNGCSISKTILVDQPSALSVTGNFTNATCSSGGDATVFPSGGVGQYKYLWTPGNETTQTISNLTAGNYSCLITDANGCTITKTFTIGTTNTLVALATQQDVKCNGAHTGSASVVPSGAAGPFTYAWSPSGGNGDTATNLAAGNYSVTITAGNGCSIVKNFTITEPSAIVITKTGQTNVSCPTGSNGSLSVHVTGGSGGYKYLWAPSGGTAATALGITAGTYTLTVTDGNGCVKTENYTITEPDALKPTISKTDVSCNGASNGSATVTVTGGTGAYTYLWAPSGGTAATAAGLSAGTYTVTIKDANLCQTTTTVKIDEPSALTAAISKTDVLCNKANNATATVTASGGAGNYTYSWSPSGGTAATATGLSPNMYTVTVTDQNGCFITRTIKIIEPSPLSATQSHTDVKCNGGNDGAASIIVSGGTGTYNYLWAPSGGTAATATGLTAGTYTVTVTDENNCSIAEIVNVGEPSPLSATQSHTDVKCNGGNDGTASVTVTGGTGNYSYLWSPSGGTAATATGLTAGIYTVTITDENNCSITETVNVGEPSPLSATQSHTDVKCNGGNDGTASVTVTGGTGNYSYLWSPSGGTAATATGLTAGTYIVTVTDKNNCSITETVNVGEPSPLSATQSHTDVKCNGGNDGTASVTVTGGTGNYSYLWSPSGGTAATATGLTAGTYSVTVTDEHSCSTTSTIEITEPDALTLSATSINVSCLNGNNGTASVTVNGGTGNYSYLWSPSGGTAATASNLKAGTYTITVTDANSCTAFTTVEIIQPANPVSLSTSTVTEITVNGASLSGTASSDGINTDKGECLSEVGFVYAQHANPTIEDTKINVTATLGTFASTLSGLRGNRTYYIRTYAINSNGVLNYGNEVSFTTPKYTLTITAATGHTKVYGTADPAFNYTSLGLANGDTSSIITGLLSREAGENVGKYNINIGTINAGSDYIIEFKSAEFEITKANQTITWNQTLEYGCSDSDVEILTATSDSGLPISYTIANSAIATISGTTLTIIGSGSSTITALQNGDQNHNPAVTVIKPIEISQTGLIVQQWDNVLFFDNKSNNFVAWQWFKNGVAISGATRQYYSEDQPLNGAYYVVTKDKNGNSIKSCPMETFGTAFTKKIKIYPNPVRPGNEFTLECDFSESQLNGSEVSIYDITGKLVQTISNVKTKNSIMAPSQVAIYVVVLKLADGQLKTINLLVK